MTWSGIVGACLECNRPTGSDDRPYCREHRWMEVGAGAMPELDREVEAARGRQLRIDWLEHRALCIACQVGTQLVPAKFCDIGGPLFKAMEAALTGVI